MKTMKTITVFTPTYNRAYCLDQVYESLVRQTNQDFIWLIIDDGSTDKTKDLVNSWIKNDKIQIEYYYKENQGMHGAHNSAYSLINTELNVCIDSDDFMPDNAIELILSFWKEKGSNNYAGFIGLDANKNGGVLGTKLPDNIEETTVTDLYQKHKISGDKKLVYRTEVVKKYPQYPIFKEERFVPLGCLYQIIDQDYKILILNEILCIVEYMPDGSSLNMLKQYRRHPKGFAYSRLTEIQFAKTFKERAKKTIHYISSSLLSENKRFINDSPKKILTILLIPLGFLLYIYILIKTKRNNIK